MMHSSRLYENAAMFQDLAEEQGALQGPVSLSIDIAHPMQLPPLKWENWNTAGQLKITNTGYTAVITGHWRDSRPSLVGGPLLSSYSLGQIHFHWGPNDTLGSEHTIDDNRYPLEMHVLMYKRSYERPKIALKERDGIVVLVYLFELSEEPDKSLSPILEGLLNVRDANQQAPLCPTATQVVTPFTDNYFLYWGSVLTDRCAHTLAWIVSPKRRKITSKQLQCFRHICGIDMKPIDQNYCELQPHNGRSIFFATSDADVEGGFNFANITYPQLINCYVSSPRKSERCCLSARIMGKSMPGSPTIEELVFKIEQNPMGKQIKDLKKLCQKIIELRIRGKEDIVKPNKRSQKKNQKSKTLENKDKFQSKLPRPIPSPKNEFSEKIGTYGVQNDDPLSIAQLNEILPNYPDETVTIYEGKHEHANGYYYGPPKNEDLDSYEKAKQFLLCNGAVTAYLPTTQTEIK